MGPNDIYIIAIFSTSQEWLRNLFFLMIDWVNSAIYKITFILTISIFLIILYG